MTKSFWMIWKQQLLLLAGTWKSIPKNLLLLSRIIECNRLHLETKETKVGGYPNMSILQYTPVKWDNWDFCLVGRNFHAPWTCPPLQAKKMCLIGTQISGTMPFVIPFLIPLEHKISAYMGHLNVCDLKIQIYKHLKWRHWKKPKYFNITQKEFQELLKAFITVHRQ